ncbi:hypothetical protein F6X40_11190 [Paraburkholderia sp. UCT31]|uniref:DNA polymerase n=1 Tax=Paraburkholderia sp. UCT31 TaxID=2615209 RepID=UPI0016557C7B|nr:DNA polymerase [Paraburkholderia sp. UCT31]MBC8737368.1 hypothetical protein [Paraburkholderia sp. UCT31]
MQLGFDLEYTDPDTHEMVPWAEAHSALVSAIQSAVWKIVDIETTGLTPASKEQKFSGTELSRGVNPRLRLRVVSVYYKDPKTGVLRLEAFDFDRLNKAERVAVARAVLTGVMFGHNVNFDTFWLLVEAGGLEAACPTMLLDSMLLARALMPEVPYLFAKAYNDESNEELQQYATELFQGGRSGWALADLSAILLGVILPKDMQGPKNWCQPFLTQKAYEYATGDAMTTYKVLAHILNLRPGQDLLERYYEVRAQNKVVGRIEPQVMDVVRMRVRGMPWRNSDAKKYIAAQWRRVRRYGKLLVAREEQLRGEKAGLRRFLRELTSPGEGIKENLKQTLGEAFQSVGITVDVTDKTGSFKIGEKDLRKAKAAKSDEARRLYLPWVYLNKAKKAGKMAQEVSDFVTRSGDGLIHALTGHGPVTGRLASKEPNVQQFPRDQGFRNCVAAKPNHKIVASDYSALDMRVGAALAIRAQRRILECYMGERECKPEVLQAIARVVEGRINLVQARKEEEYSFAMFAKHKAKMNEVADAPSSKKAFWEEYRKRQNVFKMAHFTRCYTEVMEKAKAENTPEWGSLRNAFSFSGMDIHTWTALGMVGQNPLELFQGLGGDAVVKELKKWKKELGSKRQTGKVGNLSLLYAMQTLGLIEAAAKNYDIHWTFEEGDVVRVQWLAAYVEVDLWHAWTELNPVDTIYVPDPERGMKAVKKAVYESQTLGDRTIYAFGLNAALAFEDQSTGADILGVGMDVFRREHSEIFGTIVNQVHDELVFEIPDEKVEVYTKVIETVMVDAAELFLGPFGVKGECSPAIGNVWLKD